MSRLDIWIYDDGHVDGGLDGHVGGGLDRLFNNINSRGVDLDSLLHDIRTDPVKEPSEHCPPSGQILEWDCNTTSALPNQASPNEIWVK